MLRKTKNDRSRLCGITDSDRIFALPAYKVNHNPGAYISDTFVYNIGERDVIMIPLKDTDLRHDPSYIPPDKATLIIPKHELRDIYNTYAAEDSYQRICKPVDVFNAIDKIYLFGNKLPINIDTVRITRPLDGIDIGTEVKLNDISHADYMQIIYNFLYDAYGDEGFCIIHGYISGRTIVINTDSVIDKETKK